MEDQPIDPTLVRVRLMIEMDAADEPFWSQWLDPIIAGIILDQIRANPWRPVRIKSSKIEKQEVKR